MKKYSKKQITEAIDYWEKQLKLMESSVIVHNYNTGKDIELSFPQLSDEQIEELNVAISLAQQAPVSAKTKAILQKYAKLTNNKILKQLAND